jgi:hypothetical protein
MLYKNGVREKFLRDQVVRFHHSEINERYKLQNIRAAMADMNGDLNGITQEDIDTAKELFLTTIYPDLEHRQERDRSFESLIRLLKSPMKLTHIIPSLPTIVLKYGAHFPVALRIGLNSVLAFNQSIWLENKVVEHTNRLLEQRGIGVGPDFRLDYETFREAYVAVPKTEGRKMIQLSVWVMNAGKKLQIADIAWNILDNVQESLKRNDEAARKSGANPVHEDDIRAIEYGKDTLRRILDTLSGLSPQNIERLIRISNAVELNYLDRMHAGAPAPAPQTINA